MKKKPKLNAGLPLLKTMCATCPFRPSSPYNYLVEGLTHSAMNEASRICHSTGAGNAINNDTGKPPMLCRGARDMQLTILHKMGFLKAATDKAWNQKFSEQFGSQ